MVRNATHTEIASTLGQLSVTIEESYKSAVDAAVGDSWRLKARDGSRSTRRCLPLNASIRHPH